MYIYIYIISYIYIIYIYMNYELQKVQGSSQEFQ